MKGYVAPITEENFQDASDYVLNLYRKNLGKSRAFNVVVPISTVLFMFMSLIFTYGAIYCISTADDAAVFEKFKPITAIWQFFADILMQEGVAWYINIIIFVVALLLIPMIISAVLSVILRTTAKMPEISLDAVSTKEKARALYETVSRKNKTLISDEELLSMFCAGVYIALMLAFTIYSIILTSDSLQAEDLIGLVIGMLVVFAIAFFVYEYLFMLAFFINTCLCTPKSFITYENDVYEFLCSIDPEEAKRNEEKKKQEEEKRKAARHDSLSLYADTAYYREKKAEAMRNIQKYAYGNSYSDYNLTGIHLDDKEALRQYLQSNAPDDVKAEAIKKYNDYHLDYYIE